jgi:hypothetical protein
MMAWTYDIPCECCEGTVRLSDNKDAGPKRWERPALHIQPLPGWWLYRWHLPAKEAKEAR